MERLSGLWFAFLITKFFNGVYANAYKFKRLLQENGTTDGYDHRVDPLDGLKEYKGGYDIQNKHYWASAVFTGIYGYAIALAVMLFGIIFITLLLIYLIKRGKWSWEKCAYNVAYSYNVLFTAVLLFVTAICLVFCCIILIGNQRLNNEANDVEDIIIGAANNATSTIRNIISVITTISTTLEPFNDNLTSLTPLISSRERLYLEAMQIQNQVKVNKRITDRTLKQIHIVIVVTSSIYMLVLLVGLGMIIFTATEKTQQSSRVWRWLFLIIMLVVWILTILSWVAFGLSYAAYNVVEDSCTALGEYSQNPSSNTLGSILPCVDSKTSNDSVLKLREGMYRVITQANSNISKLRVALYSNGDSQLIPHICNPFSGPPHYKLTGQCLEGTISIGNVPQAMQQFKCSINETECVTAQGQHIPNTIYRTILAYSTAAQALIDATPSLESLTNCSFVVEAFSVVVNFKCQPVKSSIHMLWAGYAGFATCSFALLMLYVRELYRQEAYLRTPATSQSYY